MEKSISVVFTINEVQVLLEIIDIAVRARGVAAAEAGLVLTRKLDSKLKEILPISEPYVEPKAEEPKGANLFSQHIIKP